MNQMMTPDVDITLVIRKSADGRMAVSVLPKSAKLKNEAQNNIVPMTLNGTPEELDGGFLQVVAQPMQKASGLISNLTRFEAQADKAAASGKGAKGTAAKESKEEKEKREKYEKNLKKAQELIAAKKHSEAVDALTEARKYAKPEDQKTIDSQIEEQKKLAGQGDLFAMLDEPTAQQQPVEQPQTQAQPAAQTQPQTQPQAQPAQQPQQPAVQPQMAPQTAPQPQAPMPQPAMPAAQQPVQQPQANPGQGYGGQYGYAQPQQHPQGWPQQPNGGYPQYVAQPAAAGQPGAYRPNGHAQYPQQPMPFEHDAYNRVPRMADPDDAPPYRPEEYAQYPDFPASMLQGSYVQPQMM